MSTERLGPPRTGTRRTPPGGSIARFLIICFFVALVATVLGIFFIANLFNEKQEISTPEPLVELAQLGQRGEVRPASAQDQLRVYYTADGVYLTPAMAPLKAGSKDARGRQALEMLFTTDPEGVLKSPVPHGVEIEAFYLKPDETGKPREVVVDLSKKILEPMGGVGAELLCVYAIVNTVLHNTEGAQSVRILIDGRPAPNDTLWGHVDISEGLTPGAMLAPARPR